MNCNPQFYILKLKWIRILGNQNFLKKCSKAWEFELLGRFAENCMMHSCSLQSLMHALPFLVLEINNIMLQFLSFSELHMNHLEIIAAKVFYEIPELLHLWVFILWDRKFWKEAETTSFFFVWKTPFFLKIIFNSLLIFLNTPLLWQRTIIFATSQLFLASPFVGFLVHLWLFCI